VNSGARGIISPIGKVVKKVNNNNVQKGIEQNIWEQNVNVY
jgi:hypothetical protein